MSDQLSEELRILLLFEEMQELNNFLEDPDKFNTFAALKKDFEEEQLRQEINQENDTFQPQSDSTAGSSPGGSQGNSPGE